MNPDELREVLEDAGRQTPPEPRAEFVRALGERLTDTHVVTVGRRPLPVRALAAVAAAVLVVVAAAVVLGGGNDEQRITTEPSISTTTSSTTTSTTSTTVTVTSTTVTTVATTAVPATTTTSAPPPPETTTTTAAPPPETTTTTTVPVAEPLRLTCQGKTDPQNAVVCEWSAATTPGVDHYRLWKHTADGPDMEVYAGEGQRAVDTDVRAGANLIYEVTAVAADGTVLAHGDTRVTCC